MKDTLKKQIAAWQTQINSDEPPGEGWMTVDEIRDCCGIKSEKTAKDHISRLFKKGHIEKFNGRRDNRRRTFYRFTEEGLKATDSK